MQVLKDIKSFVSGRDLVVFAVTIGLSNQLQAALQTIISNTVMPFVSVVSGATKLSDRSIELKKPKGDLPGIKIGWGAALNAGIVFFITLVIMVQIVKLITTRYVKSSSITWV